MVLHPELRELAVEMDIGLAIDRAYQGLTLKCSEPGPPREVEVVDYS
jgi:hypothetical protein